MIKNTFKVHDFGTRPPTDAELAYFTASVRDAAVSQGLGVADFVREQIAGLHQMNPELGDALPRDWTEFATTMFSMAYSVYMRAASVFSACAPRDDRVLTMLGFNAERIVDILSPFLETGLVAGPSGGLSINVDYDVLHRAIFQYLIETPVYITFAQRFHAAAGHSADTSRRGVFFSLGLGDLTWSISQLLVRSNSVVVGDSVIFLSNIGNTRQLLSTLSAFRSTLESYNKPVARQWQQLPKAQFAVARELSAASLTWVLCHEFAHLFLGDLLAVRPSPDDPAPLWVLEMFCDEIASRCLLTVEHPLHPAGGLLALYVLFFFDRRIELDGEASHPTALLRLQCFGEVVCERYSNGHIAGRHLLEAPQLWIEEEFYMTETLKVVEQRTSDFFRSQELLLLQLDDTVLADLCHAIVSRGILLADLTEDRVTTVVLKDDGTSQAVSINIQAVASILLSTVAGYSPTATSLQVGALVLSLVLAISGGGLIRRIRDDAALIVGILASTKSGMDLTRLHGAMVDAADDGTSVDCESAIDELLQLGIVRKDRGDIRLTDFVVSVDLRKTS